MKKIVLLTLIFVMGGSFVGAAEVTPATPAPAKLTYAQRKKAFKMRKKQIQKLVKKYKKAAEADKPAIAAELEKLVSLHMDENLAYVKERIAAQEESLNRWKERVSTDEANWPQAKAQRVQDLLTGAAKKKHKAAKKAWKKQLKQTRQNWR